MAKNPLKEGFIYSAKLPAWQKKLVTEMRKQAPKLKKHLWMLSSGTQSLNEVKAICLSHEALIVSAKATNKYLRVSAKDRWLLTLPKYHVGGLGILIRAKLSKSKVYELKKWDAKKFHASILKNKITLSSLVPTQVHDLISAKLPSPKSLRAIVVGGAALDPVLYAQSRELGWPLLPSYGLTECSSQVATASLSSLSKTGYPSLKILSHVKVVTEDGRICVRSRATCSYIARANTEGQFVLEDPLIDGYFKTEDMGIVSKSGLKIIGRRDETVKVLGELVPLLALEQRVREFLKLDSAVVAAIPGGRAGNRLIVVTDSSDSLARISENLVEFNKTVSGPERLLALIWTRQIPRGELGKVKKARLLANLKL